MKFTLSIDMGNAAFQEWPEEELVRILKEAEADILSSTKSHRGVARGRLRDTNGNLVGQWKIGANRPKLTP